MRRHAEPSGPPDSMYSLWYYPEENCFIDEDGQIQFNLSPMFDVWQLEEWKKTRDYAVLEDKRGVLCEFFYPCDEMGRPKLRVGEIADPIRRGFRHPDN